MDYERFKSQMNFILEIDKIKEIYRQTYIKSGQKKENDAEHSWHLAVMAAVLLEYFPGADILKVIKMVIFHDIVEIYAGDTYCYDESANGDKKEREMKSAEQVYGLLPVDQKNEFMSLWFEFEEEKTEEARFSAMLDRLQPLILNFASGGASWLEHDISSHQVKGRNKMMLEDGPEVFKRFFNETIDKAVEKGYLKGDN